MVSSALVASRRELYLDFKQAFPNTPVSDAFLRQGIELKDNQSSYKFTFRKSDLTANRPSDKALGESDAFIVYGIGLYLRKVELAKSGVETLLTYPNAIVFPDAGTFFNQDLYSIYNGETSVTINQSVVFNSLRNENHLVTPEAQQSAINARDEKFPSYGVRLIQPRLILNGQNRNEFNVQLPLVQNIGIASDDPLFSHDLVMELQGFIAPQTTLQAYGINYTTGLPEQNGN